MGGFKKVKCCLDLVYWDVGLDEELFIGEWLEVKDFVVRGKIWWFGVCEDKYGNDILDEVCVCCEEEGDFDELKDGEFELGLGVFVGSSGEYYWGGFKFLRVVLEFVSVDEIWGFWWLVVKNKDFESVKKVEDDEVGVGVVEFFRLC